MSITTLQVRKIMRANGRATIYTNKTEGHTGVVRRVKCYLPADPIKAHSLLTALWAECDTVSVTPGHRYNNFTKAVVVRCVKA